jgi:hypothetical protein
VQHHSISSFSFCHVRLRRVCPSIILGRMLHEKMNTACQKGTPRDRSDLEMTVEEMTKVKY